VLGKRTLCLEMGSTRDENDNFGPENVLLARRRSLEFVVVLASH
jgi:hypothetical protein